MGLPIIYRRNSTGINPSYDWTDVATGEGYVGLDLCAVTKDASVSNILTQNSFNVGELFRTNIYNAQTFVSSPLVLPRIIKGNIFISATFYVDIATGGTYTKVKFTLMKNNLEIASSYTDAVTGDAATSRTVVISVPQTSFKVGDIIGIKAEMFQNTGPMTGLFLYHDPLNADHPPVVAATNHTNCKVYIPFKILT